MRTKYTKIALLLIAAVMLIGIAFAGVASAEDIAPEVATNYRVTIVTDDGTLGTKVLDSTYLIQNESNWRYVVYDANTNESVSPYVSANLTLTKDIVFKNPVDSLCTKTDTKNAFAGTLYGNGKRFINLTGTDENLGLIKFVSCRCELNYVQLTNCNFSSTSNYNGGLISQIVNKVSPTDDDWVKINGCSVSYSNISGGKSIGGLVGQLRQSNKLFISNSYVDSVVVSGSSIYVGGLIGDISMTTPKLHIKDSWVNGSEICGQNAWVGGLIGYTKINNNLNSIIENTTVKDCKIWSNHTGNANYVGGLIGQSASANNTYDKCVVTHCTVESLQGEEAIGGLVGSPNKERFTGHTSWVNWTWVSGKENKIGSIFGKTTSYITLDAEAPQHYMVNGSGTNVSVSGIDNSFTGISTRDEAIAAGLGSVIDKQHLVAGKDYGYLGPAYEVIVNVNDASMGTASASQTAYLKDQTVTLTATAKSGYEFSEWTSEDVTISGNTFTMPANAVTITATFVKKSSPAPYTPSPKKQTGSTVILQEGQVAPNQVPTPTAIPTVTPTPTPTPTVKPTVKPIETPAGNTTIKPTQPTTSKSPAPLAGLLAGLGAALVIARLRK